MSERLRWMITGASGMVGADLADALRDEGEDVTALSRAELDVTDGAAVRERVRRTRPQVIVNCAAFTRVDDCETNAETADLVNGHAVRHLAAAADEAGALLTHISSDFVFDGASTRPYREDDAVGPISAYGRSKLLGERSAAEASRHLIVRTSWLFGTRGANFVGAIRRQIDAGRRELRVVADQRGRPTYTPHLADALVALSRRAYADSASPGIVHYADEPECTWFDFAVEIAARLAPGAVTVHPVTTAEFPRPAQRPAYSVLSTEHYEAITGKKPGDWREGLGEYLRARKS
ncbi:MAG: dTDP-4-dehydrorhamnose reductase [Thermoanaerobaculia bacterium]